MTRLTVKGSIARDSGFRAQFDLDLDCDGVSAIVGSSGAGKSTLLRAIAGLEPGFEVTFDGASWTQLPVHRRPVSMVFQDGLLFDHLDVRGNLQFATKRNSREGPAMSFDEVVERLTLTDLLDRSVETLSGGQRQRVGLGRALLRPASIWLLDEPLASLDPVARAEIAPHLDELCSEHAVPILYVTHALDDVLQLADRVIAVEGGTIAAALSIDTVTHSGINAAGLDAQSVLECHVHGYDSTHNLTRLDLGADALYVRGRIESERVRVRIAARDVSIATGAVDHLSLLNRLRCRVLKLTNEASGSCLLELDCVGQRLLARITTLSRELLALHPGQDVTALIKAVALTNRGGRG